MWEAFKADLSNSSEAAASFLRLAIIKGISVSEPHWYRVTLSPNIMSDENHSSKVFLMQGRSHTMTPKNSDNLDRFIRDYERHGICDLHIGVLNDGGFEPISDGISYDGIKFRDAYEIGMHDPDICFLQGDEDVLIPTGVENPPILEALEYIRAQKKGKRVKSPKESK